MIQNNFNSKIFLCKFKNNDKFDTIYNQLIYKYKVNNNRNFARFIK